jgi:hypothetical protein
VCDAVESTTNENDGFEASASRGPLLRRHPLHSWPASQPPAGQRHVSHAHPSLHLHKVDAIKYELLCESCPDRDNDPRVKSSSAVSPQRGGRGRVCTSANGLVKPVDLREPWHTRSITSDEPPAQAPRHSLSSIALVTLNMLITPIRTP